VLSSSRSPLRTGPGYDVPFVPPCRKSWLRTCDAVICLAYFVDPLVADWHTGIFGCRKLRFWNFIRILGDNENWGLGGCFANVLVELDKSYCSAIISFTFHMLFLRNMLCCAFWAWAIEHVCLLRDSVVNRFAVFISSDQTFSPHCLLASQC